LNEARLYSTVSGVASSTSAAGGGSLNNGSTPDIPTDGLRFGFATSTAASSFVGGDSSDVSLWNLVFDLPSNGSPFTSVYDAGGTIILKGGSNIVLKDSLFNSVDIIFVQDVDGQVIECGGSCFKGSTITNVSLNSVTAIGDSCFGDCLSLVDCNMSSLQTALSSSFNNTPSLTNIELPALVDAGNSMFLSSGLVSAYFSSLINVPVSFCQGCLSLSSINLPSAENIGSSAFQSCESLDNINFQSVLSIGVASFQGCISLVNMSLSTATSIGLRAFKGNSSTVAFHFPNVTTVGDQAFAGCKAMTEMYLNSVTSLGTTTGDDLVFTDITSQSIVITIPLAIQSDGDVTYLDNNNTLTIITA
jgi:hypothetical protein